MLLTTSIKLLTTEDQKKILLKSMYQFNAACNWISEFAFTNSIFSKVKLQQAIYYELREKFALPAQFAIRAISRVSESYKLDKKIQHTFKKTSSVEYDQRILNWKKLDTISILSLDGRLSIPIVFGQYAKLTERVIRNSAKLIYRQCQFYLQAAVCRICSECGHCEKLNRKSQAVFKCRNCYQIMNADLNAAKNIAARALVNRLIATEKSSSSKPITLVVGN